MNTRVLEQRPVGALGRIGVVAGLHAAVIYLVATGLGIVPKLELAPDITTRIIDERPPDEIPPPVDPPEFVRQTVAVPQPEVPPIEFDVPTNAIGGEIVDDPPVVPPVDRTPAVVLQGVRIDPRHPLTQPQYPPAERRMSHEGTVEIEVYVLPNGRVGDARVLRSTGYTLLDQAAIDEAKRRWRLLPATRDGEPYAQWHRLRVVFELRDR